MISQNRIPTPLQKKKAKKNTLEKRSTKPQQQIMNALYSIVLHQTQVYILALKIDNSLFNASNIAIKGIMD